MQTLNKIIVCLDPLRDQQPALEKGILLAKTYQAKLELLLVVYNRSLVTNHFFSSEELEKAKLNYIESQKRWVKTYITEVKSENIDCAYDIVWHKPIYEAIIHKTKSSNADLVIKSTHHHPTVNKVFFTPNDWQLLKYCPVPLILAKPETAKTYTNVLSAIDISDADEQEKLLNQLILEQATELAEKLNSTSHVTHCYEPIAYQLWSDIGVGMGFAMGPADFSANEDSYQEYTDQLKQAQQEKFAQVIEHCNFSQEQMHLEEGYPENLLPAIVDSSSIDLLVLGSHQHSSLVGSTVEKILDQVNCDILSVQLPKD